MKILRAFYRIGQASCIDINVRHIGVKILWNNVVHLAFASSFRGNIADRVQAKLFIIEEKRLFSNLERAF